MIGVASDCEGSDADEHTLRNGTDPEISRML